MTYRVELGESVEVALRRIGHELTTDALVHLRGIDGPDADPVKAVHRSRKRCKELRGLVRLVRPALGDRYREANVTFRDAARVLSDYRDAHALLATFDDMVAVCCEDLPDGGLGPVRVELLRRATASTVALSGESEIVAEAIELIEDGRSQIDRWELDDDDSEWAAIGSGIAKTYGRGVDALHSTFDDPTAEHFHELRKRAKYTWYHLQLIEATAPGVLGPLADRFHLLSDALGDAHDLAVLRAKIDSDPDMFGGHVVSERTSLFFGNAQSELERRAVSAARRLYAESPKRFVRRLGDYWRVAEQHGAESSTGELTDLFESTSPLSNLTVRELRARAESAGIIGRWSMRRDELVTTMMANGVGA